MRELSFLLSPNATKQVLRAVGFEEVAWLDTTASALPWFAEVKTRLRSAPPLGLPVVMVAEFLDMGGNLGENLQEGRVRLVQTNPKRTGEG